jgi:autotransporter strand-loop-strand O-heptosyltransferase
MWRTTRNARAPPENSHTGPASRGQARPLRLTGICLPSARTHLSVTELTLMDRPATQPVGPRQVSVPPVPTQSGPSGIRFDFNEGCRVVLPEGRWRVRLQDLDTDNTLLDGPHAGGTIVSTKKYYIRFAIDVWSEGGEHFRHEFDPAGKAILVRMELGGLGDQIAWVGHAIAFARQHHARLTCALKTYVIPLFRNAYPDVTFLTAEEVDPARFYATYKLVIFYNDHDHHWQPADYRFIGLSRIGGHILGLPAADRRPEIFSDPGDPPIDEPYVCIATQATSQNKYWNNPLGWEKTITFLKSRGFRVICIDGETRNGRGHVWNSMPLGAEDQTGRRPLTERARWLKHAEFFVGLSSGLSWLAWAAGIPVVLISGFTHPLNEFATPYRVINWHACNSCSNDIRHQLDTSDFLWCPRHQGTDRMFECSRMITPEHVIQTIERLLKDAA